MPIFHESDYVFKYKWDQVCKAFWCRYPNPFSNHVLSEDVISREIDSNGNLFTKRLLTKTTKAPEWAKKLGIVQSKFCFIIEESLIDPVNKLLTTYTKNIGLTNLCLVHEKVVYKISPDNKHHTKLIRSARIQSNMVGVSRAIQAFALNRFKTNINKASKGFQIVLDAMYSNFPLNNKNLDQKTISQLHPILKQKFLEKTRKIAEQKLNNL